MSEVASNEPQSTPSSEPANPEAIDNRLHDLRDALIRSAEANGSLDRMITEVQTLIGSSPGEKVVPDLKQDAPDSPGSHTNQAS